MNSKQIKVNVKSFFLEEQSEPSEDNYIWAYKVYIKNNSMNTVKLVSRCWKIIENFDYWMKWLLNHQFFLWNQQLL